MPSCADGPAVLLELGRPCATRFARRICAACGELGSSSPDTRSDGMKGRTPAGASSSGGGPSRESASSASCAMPSCAAGPAAPLEPEPARPLPARFARRICVACGELGSSSAQGGAPGGGSCGGPGSSSPSPGSGKRGRSSNDGPASPHHGAAPMPGAVPQLAPGAAGDLWLRAAHAAAGKDGLCERPLGALGYSSGGGCSDPVKASSSACVSPAELGSSPEGGLLPDTDMVGTAPEEPEGCPKGACPCHCHMCWPGCAMRPPIGRPSQPESWGGSPSMASSSPWLMPCG
mmetsp:Transcript_78653/g.217456  ORF Transcript_78653/g.217456 Transcript_78653/m.217456 type:complete len:290 (+) Transcript_78653:867-1736(+)